MEKLFPVVEDDRLAQLTAYVDGKKVSLVTGVGRPNGILALEYEDGAGRTHWAAAERVEIQLDGRLVRLDQLFDNLVPLVSSEPVRKPQGTAYHRSYGVVDILDRWGQQVLIVPSGDVLDLEDRDSYPDWDTDSAHPISAAREVWVWESELVPLSELRFPTKVKEETDLQKLWLAQPPWSLDPIEGFLKVLRLERATRVNRSGHEYTVRQAICQVVWDERPDRVGRLVVVPASWLRNLATGDRLSRTSDVEELPEDVTPADLQDYETDPETVGEALEAAGVEPDLRSIRRRYDELLPLDASARQDHSTEQELEIAVTVVEFPAEGPFAVCILSQKGHKPKTVKVWRRGDEFLVLSHLPPKVKALIIRKAVWMKAKLELARALTLSA